MAQTPEQRRRNAKFAKENEAKMGKSDDQIKKRVKETPKAPISLFWIANTSPCSVLLGFIIFGGLVFEAISRFFG
ncbi:ribosome associated membrane RAMP4 domain-containing [Fusarium albosuccineum]|uniref:Stress-associated endoplasmic reticulum protein n=1 Tax=Fusarium albosuccineum TaxID=1237068 RepID=A0A8H4LBC5_9HYPO|nr:ribosome associated membrane RAMP4 domain-containing [Fusarium albosuccineum]